MRIFPAVLIACSLASPLAYAQTPANTPSAAAAPIAAAGKWRASKVIGVNVYNEANEKVGDISGVDYRLRGTGRGAVISVGGFLGMGEHLVAVPMNQLKFANEAGRPRRAQRSPTLRSGIPTVRC